MFLWMWSHEKNRSKQITNDIKTIQRTISIPPPRPRFKSPMPNVIGLLSSFCLLFVFFSVVHFCVYVYPFWVFQTLQSFPSPSLMTVTTMQDCMSVLIPRHFSMFCFIARAARLSPKPETLPYGQFSKVRVNL